MLSVFTLFIDLRVFGRCHWLRLPFSRCEAAPIFPRIISGHPRSECIGTTQREPSAQGWCLFFRRATMNKLAILLVLSSAAAVPAHGYQARTPQAALEEIATTNKPDVIARHLPEPVQKSIAVLPDAQKQLVLDKLVSLKAEHLEGCTIRRANDVD